MTSNDLSPESLNRYARIAGLAYLFIFVCGIFANFFVLESLWVRGDAALTAGNIRASEALFRIGLLSFIIMVIADVVVSWALYVVFKPVHRNISLFSAWLRLVNSAIFAIALFNLFNILRLIDDSGAFSALGADQLNSQIMLSLNSFDTSWLIGLVFFGVHLLFLGFLIIKSGFIPKLIGALLLFAGVGYLVDSTANVMLANYQDYADIFSLVVIVPGVIGELALTLWLLVRGVGKANEETS